MTLQARHQRIDRVAAAAAACWAALVVAALVVTLHSLATHDFDGLNNAYQIPLALPWWLVIPYPGSHLRDAWVTAGIGLVNAGIVYAVASRRRRMGRHEAPE